MRSILRNVNNLYFELTREFNQLGPAAVLSSGQAVVYYRLAIMSKDGMSGFAPLIEFEFPTEKTP